MMDGVGHRKHGAGEIALLVALAFAMCLPNVIWHAYPSKDTAFFYSRMIRELSAGNWQGAFFPLIPPVFTFVGAGIGLVTGRDAFVAAKITSAVFFAVTVIPLHRLFRRFFGGPAALWACILYISCPRILRYGGSGLLDTGKGFFLVAVAWATVEAYKRPKPGTAIVLGACWAGLTLIKGEGIVLAAMFGIGLYAANTCSKKGWRRWLPRKEIAVAVGVFALCVLPWVLYVNWQTGYPFTDGRQAWILNRVLDRVGVNIAREGVLLEEPAELQSLLTENWEKPVFVEGWSDRNIFEDAVMRVFSGFYPLYWPWAIWGLVLRRKQFKLSGADGYLIAVMFIHTFFLLAVTGFQWTEKRYVIVAMPFMLGWAGLGVGGMLEVIGERMGQARRRWATGILIALLLISGGVSGNSKAYRDQRALQRDPEVRAAMAVREWFEEHKAEFNDRPGRRSTSRQYHNGRRPLVAAFDQRHLYFAGGDGVFIPMYGANLSVDDLAMICEAKDVDLLIWADLVDSLEQGFSMFDFYPGLRGFDKHPAFRLLERIENEHANIIEIYAFEGEEAEGQVDSR